MKSGRQRRDEILSRRRHKAKITQRVAYAPHEPPWRIPPSAIWADQTKLLHDNTYGPRPRYYEDKRFTCIECGTEEIWTAVDQKWWYEEAKGKVASTANRCHACRAKRRMKRSQERRVHIEGLIAKHGFEEALWRLQLDRETLERMLARWAKG